jgi:hypothetical protein
MAAPKPPTRKLRTPSFGESVVFDAYKTAIDNALDSGNKAAEAITTAAFSLATAYGALIGLVAPKQQAPAVLIGLPFGMFALAALISLWTRAAGVKVKIENSVDGVLTTVSDMVDYKRKGARIAIALLSVSVVVAGALVVYGYASVSVASSAPVASPSPTH